MSMGLAKETCDDQATCSDIAKQAVKAPALLQVTAKSHNPDARSHCEPSTAEVHLEEASKCLPKGLIEKHLSDVRYQAALLTTANKMEENKKDQVAIDGATASLDAAGFAGVTALCCPPEMETFFTRLLASMGLQVCSLPHLQGLMHWFSCVPNMDYAFVLDIINNGNPCKYWAPTGATCPALTPQCQGKYCR